jgi:hypothetical protein
VDADAPTIRSNQCNSFSADTEVSTPDGDVPIVEIEVGDIVLGYHEDTGAVGEYTVTATMQHDDETIVTLTIDGEEIETTPWHLFYTDEGWQEAEDLSIGELVFSLDGDYGVIEAILIEERTQTMYDLTVDEVHTFAVGVGDWLVHNVEICDIIYGSLDEHKRPTGVTATLEGIPSRGLLSYGTKIPKGNQSGWNPRELNTTIHDRTHLVAREFGGKGNAANRVIGFRHLNQRRPGSGHIRNFELKVGDALRNGERIQLAVSPIYKVGSKSEIPQYIVMEAYGNQGTHMIEVIVNEPLKVK